MAVLSNISRVPQRQYLGKRGWQEGQSAWDERISSLSHFPSSCNLPGALTPRRLVQSSVYLPFDASEPVSVSVRAIFQDKMNATSLAFGNGEDMAELASTILVGRESMYVAVFKGMWPLV